MRCGVVGVQDVSGKARVYVLFHNPDMYVNVDMSHKMHILFLARVFLSRMMPCVECA